MVNSTACRYYTERTIGWMLNNKIIVFLAALSFCLLISTWSMAAQRNRAYVKIEELNAALASTPSPSTEPTNPPGNEVNEPNINTPTTVAPAITDAPAPEAPATEAPETEAPETEGPATETAAPTNVALTTEAPTTEVPATDTTATTEASEDSTTTDAPPEPDTPESGGTDGEGGGENGGDGDVNETKNSVDQKTLMDVNSKLLSLIATYARY